MDDLEVVNRLSNKKNIIPKYLDDDILEYAKSRYLFYIEIFYNNLDKCIDIIIEKLK